LPLAEQTHGQRRKKPNSKMKQRQYVMFREFSPILLTY